MTDTTNANGRPRHMGATREFPLVGYRPKHGAENRPRNGGPHLKADANKPVVWPLAGPSTDADPTRAVKALPPLPPPFPPAPNVVGEAPMRAKDARRLEKWCLYAAILVAVFGVVAFIAVNLAAVS